MAKKVIIASIITVLIISGIVWWIMSNTAKQSSSHSTQTQQSVVMEPEGDTSSTVAVAATITYSNSGFSPASLTVKSGDTIKVINQSSGMLQFSSDDHPAHTDHPELNMSPLAAGKEATLKVTGPGTWGYHNHLKANHEGAITVTE